MNIINQIKIAAIILLMAALTSCDDFLDVKPDQALVVPNKLADLEALLNNDRSVMNAEPAVGFIGTDDYYVYDHEFQIFSTEMEINAYTWEKEIFGDQMPYEWSKPYQQVYYANVVLEQLENIPVTEENRWQWEQLKGRALFYRSYAYYTLLQLFAAPYGEANHSKPGIVLKNSADINEDVFRSSLKESYDNVINSLKEAVNHLGENSLFDTQPDKEAAYACLSRVYLSMGDYSNAKAYADSCLSIEGQLMDYNSLNLTSSAPFARFNEEVLFHSTLYLYTITFFSAKVKEEIVNSFDANDLRKEAFFKTNSDGSHSFKGCYSGKSYELFGGLATDEIYLIRAECKARSGNIAEAMDDLNTVLEKRWKAGTFEELTADTKDEALQLILEERRKELLFRGLRWMDLRRLNLSGDYNLTLTREVGGKEFTLPPNDPRYVYPIPQKEIDASGIEQNPR